ncbi:MAG: nucleotidyltransferase domain-containing protein [Nanoarchaeota archaeon]|nr:nucleotidyltransferase domain-containing protein [Nanoarchaeota archaeon]
MVEKWINAVNEFLENLPFKKDVTGVLITGSYVTGKPTKQSDIDVQIILKDSVKYRERGNKLVKGYLIEYFANPAWRHEDYIKEDEKDKRRVNAAMFATGKILFDKTGKLKELKKKCTKLLKTRFEKMPKFKVELSKYALWDVIDDIKGSGKSSKNLKMQYYLGLNAIIRTYSAFLRIDIPKPKKYYEYFSNDKSLKKYRFKPFPDKLFSKIVLQSLNYNSITPLEKLYNHVIKEMGGFDINDWKIRSPAKNK